MRKLIVTLLICLSIYSYSQNTQILPNSLTVPSVSSFPTATAGSIVFKTPENKLYSFNGTQWNELQAVVQEGFSSQIGNYNSCCNYPNFPSIVQLKVSDFKYGNGTLANNSYTVSQSGVYLVSSSFTTSTFDTNPVLFFLTIYIFQNNNILRMSPQNNLSSGTNATVRLSDIVYLNSGDVIQMKIAHNYTASGLSPNGAGSYFSLVKIY